MPWSFATEGVDSAELRQVLKKLIAGQQFPEAVHFLAGALEPRAGIEWAVHSLPQLAIAQPSHPREAALHAVQTWLAASTDENRRAAYDCAHAAGFNTPEGCLAMSVFFSGGSIAPLSAPAVPAPPDVCQKMLAGAMLLAVLTERPEASTQRFTQALTEPK